MVNKDTRATKHRTEDLPNSNCITGYLHCAECLKEVQAIAEREGSASPRDYARLSIGFTPQGLQVWCNRHESNVLHVDFQGHVHPANMSAEMIWHIEQSSDSTQ